MSDVLVKMLRGRCNCNMPSSPCGSEDECRFDFQVADRIEELEADLRKMALDYLAAEGQASENFQMYVDANEARIDAEAKLAKVKEAFRINMMHALSDYTHEMFDKDYATIIGETDA
jgi:hypothetical protein